MNEFFNMNNLLKGALSTGLNVALMAGEKFQQVVEELVEKGKDFQEKQTSAKSKSKSKKNKKSAPIEEVDAVDAETVEAEAAHAETEEAPKAEKEPKSANRWEEYEHKLKDLVSTAISKLNFTRNDDHARLEARIAALEEKLSHLAELVSEQGGNNKGQ